MRFYRMMSAPAPRKRSYAIKLLPISGGFIVLSALAVFNQQLAMALAVGTIAFAAISMLVAITRKH
jgi:hypothetical protein